MLGGCLASSGSAAREPLPRFDPPVVCEMALTPGVEIPASEPDLEPLPGGYFVTDSQMASVQAQLGNCRFQRGELRSHRAIVCDRMAERSTSDARLWSALQERDDSRLLDVQEWRRAAIVGTAAGLGAGFLLGAAAGVALAL